MCYTHESFTLECKVKAPSRKCTPTDVSKSREYFRRKLNKLTNHKSNLINQPSITSKALLESYKAARKIAKSEKTHIITKELILPAL